MLTFYEVHKYKILSVDYVLKYNQYNPILDFHFDKWTICLFPDNHLSFVLVKSSAIISKTYKNTRIASLN